MHFKNILLGFMIVSLNLLAQDLKRQSINIVQAFNIDNGLKYIIPDAIGGDIRYRDNALVSLSYTHYTHEYLIRKGASSLQFGWEFIAAQHYGKGEVLETDALFFIKYARILPPCAKLNTDFTWGYGASYVWGNPYFDDDPYGREGEKYPLITYFMIDWDFYLKSTPDVHFFFRIHHRSGVYGLVAPVNVGTNFLGYGFRYFF